MELVNVGAKFVGASDFGLETLGTDRVRITTGVRTIVAEVNAEESEELHQVMSVVLPLLRRSTYGDFLGWFPSRLVK